MTTRRRDDQEGQVFPALLVVVVCLILLGLAFAQYGSAGDQVVRVQTAADAASVAAAHRLRDATLSTVSHERLAAAFPFGAEVSADVTRVRLGGLLGLSCRAATQNWNGNPHRSLLDCGDLRLRLGSGDATVTLVSPEGEVVGGPADVDGVRTHATATARVVVGRCPRAGDTPEAVALAHWLADATSDELGTPGRGCLSGGDELVLTELAELPLPAQVAAIGPVTPLVRAVAEGLRVEIVH